MTIALGVRLVLALATTLRGLSRLAGGLAKPVAETMAEAIHYDLLVRATPRCAARPAAGAPPRPSFPAMMW